MRAEVLELVFAAAIVVVFASAVAAFFGRVSRPVLATLAGAVAVAAVVGWVAFAIEPSRELAVAAAGLIVCAALQAGTLLLQRLVTRAQEVDRRLLEAEERFDTLITTEVEARAA